MRINNVTVTSKHKQFQNNKLCELLVVRWGFRLFNLYSIIFFMS